MQRCQLAEKYLDMIQALRKCAFSYFKSPEDVEDILQSAFLKAWTHCEALRDDRLFVAWIQQIVRNEALTVLRKRHHMNETLVEDMTDMAASYSMEDELMTRMHMEHMLGQIGVSLAEPIYLHYLAGYSIEEIAQMLNRPDGTIKSMLYRARKILGDICVA